MKETFSHSTILEQIGSTRKLDNFRNLSWRSSNNPSDSRSETFWTIKTNFRKHKFIQYLEMKYLMMEMSLPELRCLFDAPGVLNDDLYFGALRAWKTEIPKEILWKRLAQLQRITSRPEWSPQIFGSYDGSVKYEISEMRNPVRKFIKYSGYVRNSSQVGSKRKSSFSIVDPESFEWTPSVEIDFFLFLTVGEFDTGIPGSTITLKMDQSKIRNG